MPIYWMILLSIILTYMVQVWFLPKELNHEHDHHWKWICLILASIRCNGEELPKYQLCILVCYCICTWLNMRTLLNHDHLGAFWTWKTIWIFHTKSLFILSRIKSVWTFLVLTLSSLFFSSFFTDWCQIDSFWWVFLENTTFL